MDRYDHFEVLKAIRGAKQTSDFAAFSIHAHETASEQSTEPGDFLPKLFHNAIDASADIVATHGTHVLAGIEIYKGKPIFYGLGSLIFQLDLYHATTSDVLEILHLDPRLITSVDYHDVRFARNPPEWYESVIAISEFHGDRLKEVRLYPLDLGAALDAKHRGVPRLASTELAQKILEWIRRYSAPYGTMIGIENNIGIIRSPR
jgi:poly-gamma-glutamate synthesis protein (capsule biosynthesis protein)